MARRRTPPRNASGRFVSGSRSRRTATNPRGVYKRPKRHRSLYALQTIPEGVPVKGLTMLNPGGLMPTALIANPRRRRKARKISRSAVRAYSAAKPRRRRRSYRKVRRVRLAGRPLMVTNPRRRRRHYRRNPSGMLAAVKAQFKPILAATAASFAVGMLDTKLLSDKPMISGLVKVGGAVAASILLRRKPAVAAGIASGLVASFGYSMGVKVGGGMVATSKANALKGLADMAAEDEEMAALLQDLGLGVLTPGVNGLTGEEDPVAQYQAALAASPDDDDDDE